MSLLKGSAFHMRCKSGGFGVGLLERTCDEMLQIMKLTGRLRSLQAGCEGEPLGPPGTESPPLISC